MHLIAATVIVLLCLACYGAEIKNSLFALAVSGCRVFLRVLLMNTKDIEKPGITG
jgi:hypothetical protein